MKKVITLVLALMMAVSAAGCSAEEESAFATLEAKDCYDEAGFTELIAGAEAALDIEFTAVDSENVEWSIYVFDEAFDDGFRYISQSSEPVLTGDGTVSIEAGQFVYVYCSVNEFTADAPDENAKLQLRNK